MYEVTSRQRAEPLLREVPLPLGYHIILLAIHSVNISAPQSTSTSGGLVAKPFSREAAGRAVNMPRAEDDREFRIARGEAFSTSEHFFLTGRCL